MDAIIAQFNKASKRAEEIRDEILAITSNSGNESVGLEETDGEGATD